VTVTGVGAVLPGNLREIIRRNGPTIGLPVTTRSAAEVRRPETSRA
jgi:hypothetical protein